MAYLCTHWHIGLPPRFAGSAPSCFRLDWISHRLAAVTTVAFAGFHVPNAGLLPSCHAYEYRVQKLPAAIAFVVFMSVCVLACLMGWSSNGLVPLCQSTRFCSRVEFVCLFTLFLCFVSMFWRSLSPICCPSSALLSCTIIDKC